jgi:branched-chain amino acid transport system permease protein
VATLALAASSFYLQSITDWRLAIFGLMTLFVVYYVQDGIVGYARDVLERIRPELVHRHAVYVVDARKSNEGQAFATGGHRSPSSGDLLAVDQVVMQFGGLKALDKVDLRVARGTIHALIGPNGSGKSTMINVLTGIYQPTAGTARLGGNVISGKKPAQIARAGVARTFQNLQLFGEMTTIENVLVGLHHTYKSNLIDVVVGTSRYRDEERSARIRAASLLDFVRLDDVHDEEARNLSYGKQRLLEIARALAIDPDLILLDEPAAGMTGSAIDELCTIIEKIREHGITVLMVEHHMDMVMRLSNMVTVFDFGRKISEGEPAVVRADPKVIAAYLGGETLIERVEESTGQQLRATLPPKTP